MAKNCPKRLIVKIGTGVLTRGVGELDTKKMGAICSQVAEARKLGYQVSLVSSGAVGLGMGKLGLKVRPKQISAVQKCAAVGQGILIQTWAKLFAPYGITVAQILLTRDDVDVRARFKAMQALMDELLKNGIVPIINENDCISAAELNIKFGDNDVLSSLVADLSNADILVILSTAQGLIDLKGTGKVVPIVEKITPEIRKMAGGTTSATAVGGMITKIKAAEIATGSGCDVYIADGRTGKSLSAIVNGTNPGTKFLAREKIGTSRKRWIAHFGKSIGKIIVDSGAAKALCERGSSLLHTGVKEISGKFAKGDLVEILNDHCEVVARGLAEIDAESLRKKITSKEKSKCGHKDVAVHRDNLAIV